MVATEGSELFYLYRVIVGKKRLKTAFRLKIFARLFRMLRSGAFPSTHIGGIQRVKGNVSLNFIFSYTFIVPKRDLKTVVTGKDICKSTLQTAFRCCCVQYPLCTKRWRN